MKRNFHLPSDEKSHVIAVLGPTNTGKTHQAITRMLGYKSGVIGFPLRLLARENYDRIVAEKGAHKVALVTGEEKIIPSQACYYVCTVEAMPIEKSFDFLAVDEIQLCADPERGHIFTDRLLRARGQHETMFMGAETIRNIIRELIPEAEFESRERLSNLEYTGFRKLSRLPKRSAIVSFSMEDVYRNAEMIRRHRGGTAIVLGALSPRTRNAQVGMYQSGEVDYMVATDAIGMGLNMDINHVSLAAIRKYDGARPRPLRPPEIAQIAGRAGRAKRDGTYGVTGNLNDISPEVVESIRLNTFPPLEQIIWRNPDLDFSSTKALLNSLSLKSGSPLLVQGRTSDDHKTLSALLDRPDIQTAAATKDTLLTLWDTCQIPDFRKTLSDTHQEFIAEIFFKSLNGYLPEDWIAKHIKRLENTSGEVDMLMTRIAHVRTWTFIAHRNKWLKDPLHWQEKTKALEDKLSDVLHEALTNRFVDRRQAVLMRALEKDSNLLAGVQKNGNVIVEGEKIGQLQGFRFIPEYTKIGHDHKAVMAAARNTLKGEIKQRVQKMLNAEAKQFTLNDDGQVFYQENPTNPTPGEPIGRVKKGQSILSPEVTLSKSDLLEDTDQNTLTDHITSKIRENIATTLEPLFKLNEENEKQAAPVRGILHQLHEALGFMPRAQVEDLISEIDPDGRRALREKRVKLGPILIFMPLLGKPATVRLRALLWNLWNEKDLPADVPRDGSVSQTINPAEINRDYYQTIGYPVYGTKAIRADMLDRIVSEIYDTASEGKFKAQHKMAEWLGCTIPELYDILTGLGHKKIHDPAEVNEIIEEQEEPELRFVETTEEDREFFTHVHHTAYREIVEKMFGWDEKIQDDMASKAFDEGGMHIVWQGDQKIGVVGWDEHSDHLWLKEVFLLPEFQNKGFESQIVQHSIKKAGKLGKEIRLQTLKENLGAKKLYEKHGFKVDEETDTHWKMVKDVEVVQNVKPELATFAIKRGKANEKQAAPHKQPSKSHKKKGPSKSKAHKPKPKMEAKAKLEDSPFAVLKDLKVGNEK